MRRLKGFHSWLLCRPAGTWHPAVHQIAVVSPIIPRLNPQAPRCYSVCLHSHQLAVRQCARRQRWAQGRALRKCAACITKALPSRAVTHARSHLHRVVLFWTERNRVHRSRRTSAGFLLMHFPTEGSAPWSSIRGEKWKQVRWLYVCWIILIWVNSKPVHDSKKVTLSTDGWTFGLPRI